MGSVNNISGNVQTPTAQARPNPAITKTAVSTDTVMQPSEVVSRFKDFRQVVEKSSDQLDTNRKQLEQAVQELKRTADTAGRALGFRIDPVINGSIVTVSNLETGQVIRQIPDEVVVRVAHYIEKMKGLLLDGKL